MSTTQWILNLVLLAWVLLRNLGVKTVTRTTFAVPLLIVGVAAAVFLRDVPTIGNDLQLEVTGALAGVVLGIAATALTRVRHTTDGTVITAGWAFAALWIAVIGGRIAFAEWATGSGARAVGTFSIQHQITGADAWTAAFVLMALAMVLTRSVSTFVVMRRRMARPGVAVA